MKRLLLILLLVGGLFTSCKNELKVVEQSSNDITKDISSGEFIFQEFIENDICYRHVWSRDGSSYLGVEKKFKGNWEPYAYSVMLPVVEIKVQRNSLIAKE